MAKTCSHVAEHVKKVKPHTKGCEECLKAGTTWVHLRMCLECGHVGCCDSSRGPPRARPLPLPLSTRSSNPPSAAKTGAGATSTKCISRIRSRPVPLRSASNPHRSSTILKLRICPARNGSGFADGAGAFPFHRACSIDVRDERSAPSWTPSRVPHVTACRRRRVCRTAGSCREFLRPTPPSRGRSTPRPRGPTPHRPPCAPRCTRRCWSGSAASCSA